MYQSILEKQSRRKEIQATRREIKHSYRSLTLQAETSENLKKHLHVSVKAAEQMTRS